MTRITIVDGHPDPAPERYGHALAQAYQEGAVAAGHDVRRLDVALLDFPLVRSQQDWRESDVPTAIAEAQEAVSWAEHLVFVYPLWLGDVPALLKGFLEQVVRPHFAFRYRARGLPEKLLKGRSARIVVTMGMPALYYRLFYRAHSLKSFERNILGFTGIAPVRHSIVGSIASGETHRRKWLARVRRLGAAAL